MAKIIKHSTKTIKSHPNFSITSAEWSDGNKVFSLLYKGFTAINVSIKDKKQSKVLNKLFFKNMSVKDRDFYDNYKFYENYVK